MQSFINLICAIEFIEDNLMGRLSVEAVALAAYISSSHLQKMFSRVFRCSVGEYFTKRRLCQSAHLLINTNQRITDVALDCGYENTESFSRAFKKQFLASPSVYRKTYRFSNLYPKFTLVESDMKEGLEMIRKYDLSEISSKILSSKGTYIISADIDHLMQINETMGHETGDIALAESSARIERSIGKDMSFFRIGNDNFVILTGTNDLAITEEIAKKILSYSDDELKWNKGTFKFSLSMGITLIPCDLIEAKETIEKVDAVMIESKKNGRNAYMIQ